MNYFVEISPSGEYIVENYIPSGGSALMNCYKDNFGAYEVQQAEKEKRNVWEIIYGLAGDTPPGNRGVMAVPYFQGANGPYWDMTAKGVIAGLRQEYGRPYFIRGFIEGLEKMVGIRKSYKPVPQNVSKYEKLYTGVYNKLYDQLHDLMREASEIIDTDKEH